MSQDPEERAEQLDELQGAFKTRIKNVQDGHDEYKTVEEFANAILEEDPTLRLVDGNNRVLGVLFLFI